MTAGVPLSLALQERFSRRDLRFFDRVLVVDRCGSTQDVAKQACEGKPGVLVVAERQTAGRGRLGRAWADTTHLGVAATFVLDAGAFAPEHVSLIAGLGACVTCEIALDYNALDMDPWGPRPVVPLDRGVPWVSNPKRDRSALKTAMDRPVALRWPNDVVELTIDHLRSRKIAGVLIERVDNLLLVGVGINVLHARADWPLELAGKAVSLRELGTEWSRGQVAVQLVTALDALLAQHPSCGLAFWRSRDALTGRYRTFEHNNRRFAGTVESIDPAHHIVLRLDDGSTISLPALTTSLVHQ